MPDLKLSVVVISVWEKAIKKLSILHIIKEDKLMKLNENALFSIDRVRVNMYKPKEKLKHILPLRKLNKLSKKCHLKYSSKKARISGFASCIEIINPKREALILLAKYESKMGKYKISYIEITRDFLCKNKEEVIDLFNIFFLFCKKSYTHRVFVYDALKHDRSDNRAKDPNKFHDKTIYLGSKYYFELVIYPRINDEIDIPGLRTEWKIHRASNIKRKTGIESISDLIDFDFDMFFLKQDNGLKLLEINDGKFGRWLNKIPSKPNTAIYKAQAIGLITDSATNAGSSLRQSHGIKTTAKLIDFLKKERKRINKKRGKRSDWDSAILKLTPYKINTFFVNCSGVGLI